MALEASGDEGGSQVQTVAIADIVSSNQVRVQLLKLVGGEFTFVFQINFQLDCGESTLVPRRVGFRYSHDRMNSWVFLTFSSVV